MIIQPSPFPNLFLPPFLSPCSVDFISTIVDYGGVTYSPVSLPSLTNGSLLLALVPATTVSSFPLARNGGTCDASFSNPIYFTC